mmetsp:Transcript_645/g.1289  ORF Transcript_645/g.1289 Transcript_645/m.1289 type:complete len:241 (-) Transcript_645:406-1128(-)
MAIIMPSQPLFSSSSCRWELGSDAKKLDFKHKSGIGQYTPRREPGCSVGVFWRAGDPGDLSYRHGEHPFIPALDHLTLADSKREGLLSVVLGAPKLLAQIIILAVTSAVHGHLTAQSGPGSSNTWLPTCPHNLLGVPHFHCFRCLAPPCPHCHHLPEADSPLSGWRQDPYPQVLKLGHHFELYCVSYVHLSLLRETISFESLVLPLLRSALLPLSTELHLVVQQSPLPPLVHRPLYYVRV